MKYTCRKILSALVLLVFSKVVSLVQAQNNDENAQIPAPLLASALNHAVQSEMGEEIISKLYAKDVDSLYVTAKSMFAKTAPSSHQDGGTTDRLRAVQIFHALADGKENHIPSMVQLGLAYSEQNRSKAIQYFVQAGEDGPHQASLYNAGRLFAEEGQLAPALAYMKAAVALSTENPKFAREQMTETARDGYAMLCKQLETVELSLQSSTDLFPYADLNGFPPVESKAEKLWNSSMAKLQQFGKSRKSSDLEISVKNLSTIDMTYRNEMSKLQIILLRRILATTMEMMNDEL